VDGGVGVVLGRRRVVLGHWRGGSEVRGKQEAWVKGQKREEGNWGRGEEEKSGRKKEKWGKEEKGERRKRGMFLVSST
jgi:hypothetical protein